MPIILEDFEPHSRKRTIVIDVVWKKSHVVTSVLTNNKRVWFQTIYKKYIPAKTSNVLEVIDEKEYLFRLLAGTLETEFKVTTGGNWVIGP